MLTETQTPSITLYYRAGNSDKVYQVAIEPAGSGDKFAVVFQYGRRGSTLQTGTKTNTPVDFDVAKKIFDRLVLEKTSKGYTPSGETGTPYQQTLRQDRATGILPQLLNPIDEAEAEKLIIDSGWLAQQKFDGRRVLIRRSGDKVDGINRQGLIIALPEPIAAQALTRGSQQWIIDGEAVGDAFFAFDLLESACVDLRQQPYSKRLKALQAIVGSGNAGSIRGVETAVTTTAKRAMLARLRNENAEGLVLKRADAVFTAGRPASAGDQLKLKFVSTASCIVAGTNGSKRSVKLELIDNGRRVGVGNVTVPVNQPMPSAGDVVEVRYLYAYPGGSLYQPILVGRRDDVTAAECRISQLKLKSTGDSDDI